jgi:sigma-B regulation protein RsbU (phosphoserine phosphatase)
MRILLADDERIVRRVLQRQIEAWGHEVVAAENGAEAWVMFQAERFPIVISDWEMPEMDGLQLVQKIRAADGGELVYIMLLTARSEQEDIIAGMDAGADDFLSKPCEPNELRVRLRAGERIVSLQRKLAEHNRRMTSELEAAARYVQVLIPPPLTKPVRTNWHYQPSTSLGGDTFGYHRLGEDLLALYLVDVSGHGVDSALLSVTIRNVIRSGSLPGTDFRQPGEVLSALNAAFPMEDYGEKCFSIWYGVLNTAQRQLIWSGAGHPDAFLFEQLDASAPKLTRLPSGGPMIGMTDWDTFETGDVTITGPARLYVYSDGVYEIHAVDGSDWSQSGLAEFLANSCGDSNTVLDSLWEHVCRLRGGDEFEDDFSILEVCIEG